MTTKTVNKAGRIPSSQRDELDSSDFTHEDLDYNLLKLDPELKAELDGQGLAYQWINAKQFAASGNFHPAGWRPYRRVEDKAADKTGSLDFSYGKHPEGYIQRMDLILGVKPIAQHKRYQGQIRARAERLSGAVGDRAKELREAAKQAGVKAKIHDGYDDND